MSDLRLDQTWKAGDCEVRLLISGEGDLPSVWDDVQRLCMAVEKFIADRPAPPSPSTNSPREPEDGH